MREGDAIKNIGRCPRCNKALIEEEFQSHECEIKAKGVEEIVVDNFCELIQRDGQGHRLIVAQGLDGVLYWLIECKHNPPHTTKRKFTGYDTKQGLDRAVATVLVT